MCYEVERIRYNPVPQSGQRPFMAGRPFFIFTFWASFISFLALHFTQYASIRPPFEAPPHSDTAPYKHTSLTWAFQFCQSQWDFGTA